MIKSQLSDMLRLQWCMNCKVHPEWNIQGYDWNNAIIAEVGEYLDSVGYKWWKASQPDTENAKMELVDIWHFVMSKYMSGLNSWDDPDMTNFNGAVYKYVNIEIKSQDVLQVSGFINAVTTLESLYNPWDVIYSFFQLLQANKMTWDDLVSMYFAKNALNTLRQAHGYKSGEYQKQWRCSPQLASKCSDLTANEQYEDNKIVLALVKDANLDNFQTILDTIDSYYVNEVLEDDHGK